MRTLIYLPNADLHHIKIFQSLIAAASLWQQPIDCVLFTAEADATQRELNNLSERGVLDSVENIRVVLCPDGFSHRPDVIAKRLCELILPANDVQENAASAGINASQGGNARYRCILAPSSQHVSAVLPQLAAKLDVGMLSDITAILDDNTVQRGVYAGNAITTVSTRDPIVIASVRCSAFSPSLLAPEKSPVIQIVDDRAGAETANQSHITVIAERRVVSSRPELASASVVVAGGRGMGDKTHFALIEALADKLGAAIGASRAAVDAGFIGNDHQVGQTGKVVAPEVYIAVGISGAIQHIAGMKGAKTVIAINKDPDAPIFKIADYGFVGDALEVLPALIDAL
uniref:FAD-binding protein n=1 Tax=Thaumasiovibrio occultus TaxID=1891184 RepID=UPI000B34ED1E|nr:FAD-binding protein [Thaumasiovibrio occultus]